MKSRRHYRNCLKFMYNLNSKQLVLIAGVIITVWFFLFLYGTFTPKPKNDNQLKEEILSLSEKYIKELSIKQENVVDGPYSGHFTGYDLKKTFAVLLQNILERIKRLEDAKGNKSTVLKELNTTLNINSRILKEANSMVDFKDLLKGKQESCQLNLEDKLSYPECDEKIEWMSKHWKTHECYGRHGVDGSLCSIVIYLSEIESYCPKLRFRLMNNIQNISYDSVLAEPNLNLTHLLDKLTKLSEPVMLFMRRRLNRMWAQLTEATIKLNQTQHFQKRTRKVVLIYFGFLSSASKLGISKTIFSGGPLGELVQWTDLTAGLFLSGHEIIIFNELPELQNFMKSIPNLNVPCQTKKGMMIDIIFTDIIGYNQITQKIEKYKCALRILDTFGTHPVQNNGFYLKKHRLKQNSWMGKLMELKQFYTMFPHTPDNTFLGFIVEGPTQNIKFPKKKTALVYGKHVSMWKNITSLLDVIKTNFEVHATVEQNKEFLPSFAKNHGFLFGTAYMQLLSESMIFVGLGFPYEGPGPLEAIAHGAIFLNPQLKGNLWVKMKNFFSNKPTGRELNSQHPYVQEIIGEPYSYLVDIENKTDIEAVLEKVLQNQLTKGFVPYEFTARGFIERLAVLVQKQEFCSDRRTRVVTNKSRDGNIVNDLNKNVWPPLSSAYYFLGVANESCQRTCERRGLRCESSYTEIVLNHRLELQQRGVWCENIRYDAEPVYPSYNPLTRTCYFQIDHYLFSCSAQMTNHMRFCGCRDFIPDQLELCKSCL